MHMTKWSTDEGKIMEVKETFEIQKIISITWLIDLKEHNFLRDFLHNYNEIKEHSLEKKHELASSPCRSKVPTIHWIGLNTDKISIQALAC